MGSNPKDKKASSDSNGKTKACQSRISRRSTDSDDSGSDSEPRRRRGGRDRSKRSPERGSNRWERSMDDAKRSRSHEHSESQSRRYRRQMDELTGKSRDRDGPKRSPSPDRYKPIGGRARASSEKAGVSKDRRVRRLREEKPPKDWTYWRSQPRKFFRHSEKDITFD